MVTLEGANDNVPIEQRPENFRAISDVHEDKIRRGRSRFRTVEARHETRAQVTTRMIDFDANFLVDVFERGSASGRLLDRWVHRGESVSMSSIAWAEFLGGPVSPGNARAARELLGGIEPVTEADAVLAADLFKAAGRRVRSLPDCMIAAVAIRRRAQLATLDKADFNRFRGLGLQLA